MLGNPNFYDPKMVGVRREPDINQAMQAGLAAGMSPVRKTDRKRLAVMIDYQCSFTDFEDVPGELAVKGAVGDIRRATEWLYGNADKLTGLMISLDQHIPFQIFFPTWWVDKSGKNPDPFTLITNETVEKGEWIPLYMVDWSRNYVKTLGAFMIWPFHCMIGTSGAALVPALAEAVNYVAAARRIQPMYVFKGSVPETEHYGPFKPCVMVPGNPLGGLNTAMLDAMANYDEIYVFGEAEDFCVREGMKQTIEYYEDKPDVLKRIRFVKDGTSLVFPDKRDEADQVLADYEARGIQLVKTTDLLV